MMKFRLCALILALITLISLVWIPSNAAQINGSDLCYQYTPQMTEDTFRYLDEIYVEKYPEMSLRWLQGTDEDKKVLKKLADMITKNCSTDLQKAEAVAGWIKRNIVYDASTANFDAIEVFYDRVASCIGYAQMMQTLLRLVGVPAVWGDGHRMDTQSLTVDQMYSLTEGHAWCFVRAEGQWYLFDPLWEGSKGLTDKDYIAKHYFAPRVDMITPVYHSNALPPFMERNSAALYIDGRFMHWDHGTFEHEVSGKYYFINGGTSYSFHNAIYQNGGVERYCMSYVDDPQRTEAMVAGEIFTNGWSHRYEDGLTQTGLIHFETMYYSYENGYTPNGIVMEYNGEQYFMHQGSAHRFAMNDGDYYIKGSFLHVNPDFSGKIIEPLFIKQHRDDPQFCFRWSSSDPSVATVDENGIVTGTGKGGYILLEAQMCWADSLQSCDTEVLYVYFYKDDRVADYTDHVHTCSFERVVIQQPTCTEPGIAAMKCSCGQENGTEVIPAKGHSYSAWTMVQQPTQSQPGRMERQCDRCGHMETQSIPAGGSTEPPATEPVQGPAEPSEPSIGDVTIPSTGVETPTTEDTTDPPAGEEDFLHPERNGMDTLDVTEEGIIISVPKEMLEGYEGIRLRAHRMDEETAQMAAQQIVDQAEYIDKSIVYDMSMVTSSGDAVQPDDIVIISIPMPDGWDADRAKVYFVDVESMFVEESVSSVSDDGAYIRFIADHFSCYTLVQTAERPDEPTQPSCNSAANDDADPIIWVILAVLVVVAAAVIVFVVRKKKITA